MKNNKAYFPTDAITRHKNFDVWYEDGTVFLHIESSWKNEHEKVTIFGRMGGEMGCIKPDAKALTYYLRLERWEYVFHTLRIFKSYYVNGMRWMIAGSLHDTPFNFIHEDTRNHDVHVRIIDFKNHGNCYEIRAKDVAKLRIAIASVIAMGIKEEYKGLSEGEKKLDASRFEKIKNWIFEGKGIPYENLIRQEATQDKYLLSESQSSKFR